MKSRADCPVNVAQDKRTVIAERSQDALFWPADRGVTLPQPIRKVVTRKAACFSDCLSRHNNELIPGRVRGAHATLASRMGEHRLDLCLRLAGACRKVEIHDVERAQEGPHIGRADYCTFN